MSENEKTKFIEVVFEISEQMWLEWLKSVGIMI